MLDELRRHKSWRSGHFTRRNPRVIWIVDTGIAKVTLISISITLGPKFCWWRETNANDDNGHGTLVAGIAAAKPIDWFKDGTYQICAGVSAGARSFRLKYSIRKVMAPGQISLTVWITS